MEEHLLSTGGFSDDEIALMWVKNPPKRPDNPQAGDCWDENGISYYIDQNGVERYLPYTIPGI